MKGRQSTCSFTGHRPQKLPWGYREEDPRCVDLKRRIADVLEAVYAEGYTHFLCGMAQGCDLYFGEAVLSLKAAHADVTLEAVIPCATQCARWPQAQQARYRRLLESADVETLVQEQYSPDCMRRRNRYLVDHASLLMAVHNGLPGGALQTVAYAMGRGVNVVDIPVEIDCSKKAEHES